MELRTRNSNSELVISQTCNSFFHELGTRNSSYRELGTRAFINSELGIHERQLQLPSCKFRVPSCEIGDQTRKNPRKVEALRRRLGGCDLDPAVITAMPPSSPLPPTFSPRCADVFGDHRSFLRSADVLRHVRPGRRAAAAAGRRRGAAQWLLVDARRAAGPERRRGGSEVSFLGQMRVARMRCEM